MIRPSLILAFSACTLATPAGATDFSSLLSNSPFATVGNAATAGGDKSVEFRGSYTDPGKGATFFSIYDTATQRAAWVGLNESGHPFVVRGYNQANDTVTVELNGHNINLSLKHAQVQLAAAPKQAAPGAGPTLMPNEGSPRDRRFGAMMGPEGRPDPKRMEAFIEEMRRRRAARMQNFAAEGQGPQPQANGAGMPTPAPMPAPAEPNNSPQR
jgi:hypothetical protein